MNPPISHPLHNTALMNWEEKRVLSMFTSTFTHASLNCLLVGGIISFLLLHQRGNIVSMRAYTRE